MKVSTAAKSAVLQSLVNTALSNPGDLSKQREALVGLQLLGDIHDETGEEKREVHAEAVAKVFSTGFRIADMPQVGTFRGEL